jgi:hypothetical protein
MGKGVGPSAMVRVDYVYKKDYKKLIMQYLDILEYGAFLGRRLLFRTYIFHVEKAQSLRRRQ